MSNTQQPPQPDPTQQLMQRHYYQLIHTLCGHLPPPLADTPEALLARNHAAIARIAAMLPVNPDEADLAAHCVAARAQAEDVMLQIRHHSGDIRTYLKLNAQYAQMERTALADRALLLRLQTARHKRDATPAAANADEWAGYIAGRRLQTALEQDAVAAVANATPLQPVPGQVFEPLTGLVSDPIAAPASAPESAAAPPALASFPAPAASAAPSAPPHAVALLRAPPAARSSPPAALPASPAAVAAFRRNRHRIAAELDALPRDLAGEADYYAAVHPHRARAIRQHRGLPPDCDFGPPDDDLLHAIVTGTSAVLRALDAPAAVAA